MYSDTAVCNYMRNGDKRPHCPLLPTILMQRPKKEITILDNTIIILIKIYININIITMITVLFNISYTVNTCYGDNMLYAIMVTN